MVAITLLGTESDPTQLARITEQLCSVAVGRRLRAPWGPTALMALCPWTLPFSAAGSAHRPRPSPDAGFELPLRREPESFVFNNIRLQ
jgi:hypothetical protein